MCSFRLNVSKTEMDFDKRGGGNKHGGWNTRMDFDKHGGWNKRGGWKIFMKSINVEGGFFFEEGGIFQDR